MPRQPVLVLVLVVPALLALPGCQMNERMSGAAFGAAGGATIGGLASGSFVGAVIGGVAGGLVGYVVGDYVADGRERAACAPACAPATPPCPTPCAPTYAPPAASPCYPGQGAAPYTPSGTGYVGGLKARDARRPASQAWVERGRRAPNARTARAAYEEALRLDSQNPEAWYRLALLLEAQGERDPARGALARALESDPAHPGARQAAARLRSR